MLDDGGDDDDDDDDGTCMQYWWDIIDAATTENSVEVPTKIKNTTTIWYSNPTLGYLYEEYENTNSKIFAPPHSLQHCSQWRRYGNSLCWSVDE